jgi:dephospho-CoA kinase
VSKSGHKPVIGIIGAIGSGKSTVAACFADLGCAVIDADAIAHELLKRNDVKHTVVNSFTDKILNKAGEIDRRKLADAAFGDARKLAHLNSIIHPPVLCQVEHLIAAYNDQTGVKAIVLDMPLLIEVGWEKKCDKLVFVECAAEKRAERAKKSGFRDENSLRIRENFQISIDKKKSIADNVINNNSDFSALAGQVAEIFSNIVDNK